MNTSRTLVFSTLCYFTLLNGAVAGEMLETEGVLTLLEQIRVPARDAGVLQQVACNPGTNVTKGMLLAKQDDTEAQLAKDQAQLDLANAKRLAQNDLKVRLAAKAHEVAIAELKRAMEASERFSKSVSQTEIDRLKLATEQADLEIYQQRFDLKTAQLAVDAHEAALRVAEHQLSKRVILAPASGVVVEVLKHGGEWVEPGETVMRIVRMDRMRVEGMLPGQHATAALVGTAASIVVQESAERIVTVEGEVTFVSPEIHPVSGLVRVRVEFDNTEAKLRPGLAATIKVKP